MNEKVYFEDEAAELLVSDTRLQIWSQTMDVRGIDDFDLIVKSPLRELATIFNPGALFRPNLYTIEIKGSLGKRRLFEANMGNPKEVRRLRQLVLGLSRVIASRKSVSAPANAPNFARLEKLNHASVLQLPRELQKAESLIFHVFQEPEDSISALNSRLAKELSVELETNSLDGIIHLTTIKVIYEAKRQAESGVTNLTAYQIFRPILKDELPRFMSEVSRQLG